MVEWGIVLTIAKVASGVASTYFGIKGSLGDAHTPDGKLTAVGRHARTGLLVSGALTVLLAAFEYSKDRAEDAARQSAMERTDRRQEKLVESSERLQTLLDSLNLTSAELLVAQQRQMHFNDSASSLLASNVQLQRQVGRNTLRQLFSFGDSIRVLGELVVAQNRPSSLAFMHAADAYVGELLSLVHTAILAKRGRIDLADPRAFHEERLPLPVRFVDGRGPDSLLVHLEDRGNKMLLSLIYRPSAGATRRSHNLSDVTLRLDRSILTDGVPKVLEARVNLNPVSRLGRNFLGSCGSPNDSDDDLCDPAALLKLSLSVGIDIDSAAACTCNSDLTASTSFSVRSLSPEEEPVAGESHALVLDFRRREIRRYANFNAQLYRSRVGPIGLVDLIGAYVVVTNSPAWVGEADLLYSDVRDLRLVFRDGAIRLPELPLTLGEAESGGGKIDSGPWIGIQELRGARKIKLQEIVGPMRALVRELGLARPVLKD